MADCRSSCIKIASTMIHTATFLSAIGKLMLAFSILQRKGEMFFVTAVTIGNRLFLNLITFSYISDYVSFIGLCFPISNELFTGVLPCNSTC